MIDFDLNPVETRIIAEAARQAKVYRRYARQFDGPQDHSKTGDELFVVPEAREFPHVRNMARAELPQTSGWELMEALIFLEEASGAKPLYPRDPACDAFDNTIANRLLKVVGTPQQYRKWEKSVIGWGMTEPGAGSDPSAMRTAAVLDEAADEWVLNGEKIFISVIEEADCAITLARATGDGLNGTIGLFVIDKGTPGFNVGPQFSKLGIRNRDLGTFSLVDCRIPRSNRLSGNLKNALTMFNPTRSLIAAEALGSARAALDITHEALAQSGTTIDYTAPPDRMTAAVDRFIELEAIYDGAYLTLLHTRWLHKVEGSDKVRSAIAKVTAACAARRIIRECMDILGPNSTSKDFFLEQAMRDSRITDIYEGPGDVLRILIARELLKYSPAELS